jgi:hypothetical protein
MGGRRDDSAPGHGWLVLGLVLAAGATAAVFFTENPLYLRVALLAVCWAFIVTAFLAGSRRTSQMVAAGREAELRHAYDLELEREVAARHEYERELESRLRREAEDGMRGELARLHTELAGLGRLRSEIAALTEIRGELAGLGQIRAELAGLAELRGDLGRMRSELTEQLSGELLIERMVMRAQSVRGSAQSAGAGWDVDRWDGTRVVPAEPVDPAPLPIAPPPVPSPAPRTSSRVAAPVVQHRPPAPTERLPEESVREPSVQPRPRSPREWLGDRSLLDADSRPTGEIPIAPQPEPAPRRHRRAADQDDVELLGRSSGSWPAQSSVDAAAASQPYAATSYDGSGYDEMLFGSLPPASAPTAEPSYGSSGYDSSSYRSGHESSYDPSSWSTVSTSWSAADDGPSGSSSSGSTAYDASGYAAGSPSAEPRTEPESSGHARLEQILAESGVEVPSGGRSRRRRYRDEDDGAAGDDVLARVLGRQ